MSERHREGEHRLRPAGRSRREGVRVCEKGCEGESVRERETDRLRAAGERDEREALGHERGRRHVVRHRLDMGIRVTYSIYVYGYYLVSAGGQATVVGRYRSLHPLSSTPQG